MGDTADSVRVTEQAARGRLSSRWSALGATTRRRIVLGSLFAVSLAARDLVLLLVTGGLFALAELAPRPARRGAASS